MKLTPLILSSLMMIVWLAACGSSPASNPTPTQPPTATPDTVDTPTPTTGVIDTPTAAAGATETPAVVSDPGFNLLVALEGEVQLKRSRWSAYHPTTFGVALQRGDLLNLPSGAGATILCDGLTLWQVPAGAPAGLTNGCPQPQNKILVRGSAGVAGTIRGANDPTIPYIISPRSTNILTETPTLRWNDSGAASYTVKVRGDDLTWEQPDVTQTEFTYPGEPPLQPGVSYLLVVEDSDGRSSQEEGRPGLGFTLLNETEAETVRANQTRIAALGLTDEAEAFALAQFYVGHGLTAEAIEILAGLVEAGSQHAVVHQAMADLYTHIGLLLLAEPRYTETVVLAEQRGNIEALADVQAGLGEVYVGLGNKDEAINWLTQARENYEALGDTERVAAVAGRLERLE